MGLAEALPVTACLPAPALAAAATELMLLLTHGQASNMLMGSYTENGSGVPARELCWAWTAGELLCERCLRRLHPSPPTPQSQLPTSIAPAAGAPPLTHEASSAQKPWASIL